MVSFSKFVISVIIIASLGFVSVKTVTTDCAYTGVDIFEVIHAENYVCPPAPSTEDSTQESTGDT